MIRFSLIGPLRSGSSLISRCIDDHPDLICLCESEINRALFGDFFVKLHFLRMRKHGLTPIEVVDLLDRKNQSSVESYEAWHAHAYHLLREKYHKEGAKGIGDKSPDFYRTPELASHIKGEHRLIYTIRDPRAIYRSISADKTPQIEKDRRWSSFKANYGFWKPYLGQENVLVVRFEDLVSDPESVMRSVYSHLGAENSLCYKKDFERFSPERFLWSGATMNPDRGVVFQADKMNHWKKALDEDVLQSLQEDPDVLDVLSRFQYAPT